MSTLRMQLVFVGTAGGTYPVVGPGSFSAADRFLLQNYDRCEVGVSVTDTSASAPMWVMRQGFLRNCYTSGIQWSVGDILWGDTSGNPTPSRPAANSVRIKIGTVFKGNTYVEGMGGWQSDADVFVDVRVFPPLGEMTGVDLESTAPTLREVLTVVDSGAGLIFANRPIRRSADYSTDFNVQVDEYLARVDASGGVVVATLPPAATSADVVVNVKKVDASVNVVTIAANGAELIDDTNTFDLILQGENLQMQSNGVSWAVI